MNKEKGWKRLNERTSIFEFGELEIIPNKTKTPYIEINYKTREVKIGHNLFVPNSKDTKFIIRGYKIEQSPVCCSSDIIFKFCNSFTNKSIILGTDIVLTPLKENAVLKIEGYNRQDDIELIV